MKTVALVVDGQLIGQENVSLNHLYSPKGTIDVSSGETMDRFMNVMDGTQNGATFDPIEVQPGSDGTPLSDVTLDPFGDGE